MTIVITGASEGIGKELALQLACPDNNLALVARNEKKLQEVAGLCEGKGCAVLILPADISIKESCKKIVYETVNAFGGIDVLINNAGISLHCNFEMLKDISIIQDLFKVNVFGAAYCTYFSLPFIKKSKGSIVTLASLQSLTGFAESSLYSAGKHALKGLMESVRMELRSSGVHVLNVYPGTVDTGIHIKKEMNKVVQINRQQKMMPVNICATKTIKALLARKENLVMTTNGKLIQYIKPFLPKLVDRIVYKRIQKFYQ